MKTCASTCLASGSVDDFASLLTPGIRVDRTWAQWRMVNSLLLATVIRTGLVVVSYGCKVPAGIFVPSMAVGATFGRMVGILVKALYRYVLEGAHPAQDLALRLTRRCAGRIQRGASLPRVTRTSLASLPEPTRSWVPPLALREYTSLQDGEVRTDELSL